MNTTTFSAYVCPACGGSLSPFDLRLTCNHCATDWPMDDAVPLFIAHDLHTAAQADPDVELLFSLAGTLHWQDAVSRVYKKHKPMRFERIMYDKGADWMALLPLDKTSRVLDAGCGWGTISFQLARTCGQVHALDASVNAVRFVRLRARQDSVENVYPVRGDVLHMPFADNSFDLVVLNGVLEWAGTADTTRDPALVQHQQLTEACRVLKPDGILYVGIENRYSATYFLGQDEGHVNLKFISLMPRAIAALYHRLRRRSPYAVYTHSRTAYRALFREAGFDSVDAYAPIPQYQKFSHLIPLGHAGAVRHYVTTMFAHHKLSARLMRRVVTLFGAYRLIPWFAPCFSFIVRKKAARSHCIAADIRPRDAGSDAPSDSNSLSYLLCSGRNTILLFPFETASSAPTRVIKVSRQPVPDAPDTASHQPIQTPVHTGIPRLLHTGRWANHTVTAESAALGRPLDSVIYEHRNDLSILKRYLSLSVDWLFSFQDSTRTDGIPMENIEVARLLEPLTAAAESHLPDRRSRQHFTARIHTFAAGTAGQSLPRVTQHRDFCPSNILVDGNNLSVVDWELARLNGDPLYDLFMFLSRFCFAAFADKHAHPYCDHATAARYTRSFFFDPAAPLYRDISRIINDRCRTLGIHPDTAKLLFLSQEIEKNRNFDVLPLFVSSESCFVTGREA